MKRSRQDLSKIHPVKAYAVVKTFGHGTEIFGGFVGQTKKETWSNATARSMRPIANFKRNGWSCKRLHVQS